MHVRTGLQDLLPLVLRPDHEGVHRPLNMRLATALRRNFRRPLAIFRTIRGPARDRRGVVVVVAPSSLGPGDDGEEDDGDKRGGRPEDDEDWWW